MFAHPTRTSISSTDIPRQRINASKDHRSDLQTLPPHPDDDTELAYSVLVGGALLGLILGAAATGGVILTRRHKS